MAEAPDMDVLSASVAQRLRKTPWDQMKSSDAEVRDAVHYRVALIREDLAKIHGTDPDRALRLWEENVPNLKEPEAPDAPTVVNSIAPERRRKRRSDPEVAASDPEARERPGAPGVPALVPQPATDAEPEARDRTTARWKHSEPSSAGAGLDLQDQRRRMLLENLDKRFLVAGDVYHDRDVDHTIAFEARDKKLITRRDDAVVITAMLDLAEARGWGDIRLTGTQAFKKEAWFQARLRGMETSGYRPDALDRSRMQDALKDRQGRLSSRPMNILVKDEGRAETRRAPGAPDVRFEASSVAPSHEPRVDLTTAQRQVVSLLEKLMRARGDGPDAIARATEVAAERLRSTRVHVGKLVSMGTAPYQDKPDEKNSHFVVLEDEAGKPSKVWGVDLPRALEASRAKPGEEVVLAFKGRQRVAVDVAIRDEDGNITRYETREVDRNAWAVRRFEDLREEARTLARQAAKAADQPANLRVFDKAAPSAVPPPQVKVERPRPHERLL